MMAKEMNKGVYTYNDETLSFNFITSLSAYDKLIFVNAVVDTIINGNRYDFIVKDLITDFTIIRFFTDVDTSFINQKDDEGNDINPIIFIEQFLDETNIVEIVKANMKFGLLEELNNAINLAIQYRTGIHPNYLNDALASLVSTLEKKINEVDPSEMMKMAQKFAGMTEDFTLENAISYYMNSDVHKKNLEEIAEVKSNKG